MALTISSITSILVKLGAQIHRALMFGSDTISVTELKTFASPTPITRARDADSSADDFVLDITPNTSQSLTPIKDCMWNLVINPPPTNPMPILF